MSEQKTTTYQITLSRGQKDAVTVRELEAFLRKCPADGIVSIAAREGFGSLDRIKVTKRKDIGNG
ncbi:hypothetical protein PBI_CLEO_54 [Gordonia phage Cleo]|uniref:Uncharacterized protein n=1 Tax=Gordonia phage Gibbous TaxID=2652405 RepID=A0A5J6T3Y0_9CAUD|nr:hypothetical protein QLQ74_gp58 [Gordonia phage Gibbous]QFG05134.1 hypothetical protein SEA_GIBBOUS_58 [Gordonia phage Gibbous]QGJ96841.1 hypothetical protein PBI_CLEO_54 [Gordonia phage Cleo]QRI45987.1 hypothetical protein SEA_DRE3_58 [Gordonia phage Dre3]